jgi:hypothetical protein
LLHQQDQEEIKITLDEETKLNPTSMIGDDDDLDLDATHTTK